MLPVLAAMPVLIAQWGTGSCSTVVESAGLFTRNRSRLPKELPDAASGEEWVTREDDPGRFYLYRSGKQVGGYDANASIWRDYSNGVWSEPKPAPWEKPEPAIQNFGVVTEKLGGSNSYSISGKPASWKSVQQILGAGNLEDDSKRLRLTVIGPKDDCDRVLNDLKTHPSCKEFASRFLTQSYRNGHWATEVFGSAASNGFYLSVQAAPVKAGGKAKEIHSQRQYDGPEALAVALAEAVRRSDPSYDPNKTPDLRKPPIQPQPVVDNTWLLWIGAGILAVLLLGKKPS